MLDKVLALFAYPLGLSLVGIIIAFAAALWGAKKTSFILGLAIVLGLWTASTPLFAQWLVSVLEEQYPARTVESYPVSDVAILLGGAAYPVSAENPYGDVTEAADRILHAHRIYRAGKVRKILISGGSLFHPESQPEAETIAQMLVSLGVERAALIIEGKSGNTYENAAESAAIWGREGFESGLLVTSAIHMPRALAVFRRAGMVVEPAATDVLSGHTMPPFPLSVLPRAESLSETTNAVKELIGFAIYRWRGWA